MSPRSPATTHLEHGQHLGHLGAHHTYVVGSLRVGGLGASFPVHADAVHLLHLEHVLVLERHQGVIVGAHETASNQSSEMVAESYHWLSFCLFLAGALG